MLANIYIIIPYYIYAGAGVPSWCPSCESSRAGAGCPRGARPHIHSRTPKRVHATLLSAAALSLLNRSFKVELTSAIALIINYLGVPFRICFTKQERVKKLITSEIQRINHLKNNNLQENIIYLEFNYKTRKNNKSVAEQYNFQEKYYYLNKNLQKTNIYIIFAPIK